MRPERERASMERWLALELASTIRYDGKGSVVDDLATARSTADWLGRQADLLPNRVPAYRAVDEDLRREVVEVRRAVRALFARAVSPAPPSRADADRLMPAGQALDRLNAVAALDPVTPWLHWPQDGTPEVRRAPTQDDPGVRLVAALARAAVDFLGGPQHRHLRACNAPNCVRYFVKSHGRQEWCSPSCGNRARAARHYSRHRATAPRSDTAPS